MVNRGRSGGCITCKDRRVKCDEQKPECWACRRLNLCCGGYKAKKPKPVRFKFVDENRRTKFAIVSPQRDPSAEIEPPNSIPRPPAKLDTAVPFFLGHYASLGRYMGSARGFFELLVPTYSSQLQDSAFSLAVTAMASKIMSLWQYGDCSFRRPQTYYTKALIRLRNAVEDPAERGQPATLLAALALQFYENIAAIYGLRVASCVHINGAMSLLSFANVNYTNGMAGAYIRRYILHTEISSAMRQGRSLHDNAYSLIGAVDDAAVPHNPSSSLDVLGASVANLQARYMELRDDDIEPHLLQLNLEELRDEAKTVEQLLLDWARNVPDHWQPLRLTSGRDFDSSIPAYQSTCEAYPSNQISTIWSLWHFQRLTLVRIILLTSLHWFLHPDPLEVPDSPDCNKTEDIIEYTRSLQDQVDAVCYSTPFYLGNRVKQLHITDFDDPTAQFPSHHLLAADDERRAKVPKGNPLTTKSEHKRQMIAQGPWHAMSLLSRLLTLFSEEDGRVMVTFLRPGQKEWIREQFLRVATLLHLPQATSDRQQHSTLTTFKHDSVDKRAEQLAKEVRKGAIYMSGP